MAPDTMSGPTDPGSSGGAAAASCAGAIFTIGQQRTSGHRTQYWPTGDLDELDANVLFPYLLGCDEIVADLESAMTTNPPPQAAGFSSADQLLFDPIPPRATPIARTVYADIGVSATVTTSTVATQSGTEVRNRGCQYDTLLNKDVGVQVEAPLPPPVYYRRIASMKTRGIQVQTVSHETGTQAGAVGRDIETEAGGAGSSADASVDARPLLPIVEDIIPPAARDLSVRGLVTLVMDNPTTHAFQLVEILRTNNRLWQQTEEEVALLQGQIMLVQESFRHILATGAYAARMEPPRNAALLQAFGTANLQRLSLNLDDDAIRATYPVTVEHEAVGRRHNCHQCERRRRLMIDPGAVADLRPPSPEID